MHLNAAPVELLLVFERWLLASTYGAPNQPQNEPVVLLAQLHRGGCGFVKGHKGGGMLYVCKSEKRERNRSHRELKTLVVVIQLMDLIDKIRQSSINQMCLLSSRRWTSAAEGFCSQDRRILGRFLCV